MSKAKRTSLIQENFLLDSKQAEVLFHDFAKDMPIIDYHNHLSAQEIAENRPLGNITSAWLGGDHYKWRAMRANGIPEDFITGKANPKEKFMKWAETVPHTLRNPLFHWTHLELKRHFGIDDFLNPETAHEIYEKANERLGSLTPCDIIKSMDVKVICTTNDPTEDLRFHKDIAQKGTEFKVLPTFRSDALFQIESPHFKDYTVTLGQAVSSVIDSLNDLLSAIDQRVNHFHENGCRLSDFGLGGSLRMVDFNEDEVGLIFEKSLKGEELSALEIDKYRSFMLLYLSRKYHERSWVQQYHLGALRNNNSRLINSLGADAGCDSISDYPMAEFMSHFFDRMDRDEILSKTIAYNLNPSHNEVFATMMGNFNKGSSAGKMQWGSAWWFLDQEDGIKKQLDVLSNMGLLSRFIGMLTDSRSFLSFPRHEYFRRVLCNTLGDDMKRGRLPNDIDWIGSVVQDICYHNALNYFDFD